MLDLVLPPGDYETVAGMVIAHAVGLPSIGDSVVIELPPDPADLVEDVKPPIHTLSAQVRSIERRVPATVYVTLDIRQEADDE